MQLTRFAIRAAAFACSLTLVIGQSSHRDLTKADIERMMTELSNWGRWGKDDQLGAVNLITPKKRKQAAALVREGITVSLCSKIDMEKTVDNNNPFIHVMGST